MDPVGSLGGNEGQHSALAHSAPPPLSTQQSLTFPGLATPDQGEMRKPKARSTICVYQQPEAQLPSTDEEEEENETADAWTCGPTTD